MAYIAQRRGHILSHPFTVGIRTGLLKITLEKFQHSLKAKTLVSFVFRFARVSVRFTGRSERRISVKNQILCFDWKLFEGRLQLKPVSVSGQLQRALQYSGRRSRSKSSVEERASPIRNHFRWIEIIFRTEAIASGASAVRRVEAEGTRLKLRNADAAIGASQLL